MMSASDPKTSCKDFVEANYGLRSPLHWYGSMCDQAAGKACMLHPYAADGCSPASAQVALSLVGTPCHPFSTQRSDRFVAGSVTSHHEFETGMDELLDFIYKFQPKTMISEQVTGFDMPFEKGGNTTPLQMFRGHCEYEGTFS